MSLWLNLKSKLRILNLLTQINLLERSFLPNQSMFLLLIIRSHTEIRDINLELTGEQL